VKIKQIQWRLCAAFLPLALATGVGSVAHSRPGSSSIAMTSTVFCVLYSQMSFRLIYTCFEEAFKLGLFPY
jgi:predicted membrane-bound mannosyltransferase